MLTIRIVRRVARLLVRRDADVAVDVEVDELAQARPLPVTIPSALAVAQRLA